MWRADRAASLAAELAGPSRLALGCMGLAGVYGPVADDVARATLRAALSEGVRLFDAAPLYGDGLAETLLGELLAREPVAVVTKFGLSTVADGSLVRDSRPKTVRASVEASLRRLRRERIDVLLQHRPDPNVPDEDVADLLARLVDEGKALHVGLSAAPIARARAMQGSEDFSHSERAFGRDRGS